MPSHAGHKYFRRVTWDQVGNEKIDGNRGPERNKIKTNSTEQITHAYRLPTGRPQGSPQPCIVGAGLDPPPLLSFPPPATFVPCPPLFFYFLSFLFPPPLPFFAASRVQKTISPSVYFPGPPAA